MFTIEITRKTEVAGEWETVSETASSMLEAKAIAFEELKWESTMVVRIKSSGRIVWEREGDFAFIPARC